MQSGRMSVAPPKYNIAKCATHHFYKYFSWASAIFEAFLGSMVVRVSN